MNQRQKEVQQVFLDEEKKTLAELKKAYKTALNDINLKLDDLMTRQDADMQHVIYQIEYQKQLKTQVQSILEQLQSKEFETLSKYLTNSYANGYVGTMYDIAGQGIPLITPIDNNKVLDAIKHETKLNENLYTTLGHDIKSLQKTISAEISRGISTGLSYGEIARNIKNSANIPQNRAMTIARTEAHRIQCKATADAQEVAKSKGADVLKQWDSSLDGATRETHRKLDGQIREIDELFEVAGKKAKYPGGFGDPAEDCNCRCALLQRARWALDEDELDTLKERAEYFGLDKSADFEDYKKKYLKAAESERVRQDAQKIKAEDTLKNISKNGKIKSVVLPPETAAIRGITPDVMDAISNAFDNIKSQYDVKIDNFIVKSLGKGNEKVPFQYIPKNNGGFFDYSLAINEDYYFSGGIKEYTARIMRNYNSGALASKSIEDLIAHEMAHIMTFQDCETYGVFIELEDEVRSQFIKGMSDYADSTWDGAETIAEAFVRYRRGEELPNNVMKLLDKYILGRKK